MHQQTLTGIPHAGPAPRNRGGRPRKPDDKKPQQSRLIGFYPKDAEALQSLIEIGYAKKAPAVVRRALREAVAFERAGLARPFGESQTYRGGRRDKTERPVEQRLIAFYSIDVEALEELVELGYAPNGNAALRRALIDAAAFEKVRIARQQEERLL